MQLLFQNATVPAPINKLVNFERESDMTAGETRTVKVTIEASQMTVSCNIYIVVFHTHYKVFICSIIILLLS